MLLFQRSSVQSARERVFALMRETSSQQVRLVNNVLGGKYAVLSTAAEALARGEYDVNSEDTMAMLGSARDNGGFSSTGAAAADGATMLYDGSAANIGDREYFHTGMAGARAIERIEPGEGKVNGDPRFVLSVPVERGGQAIGVIFGSFVDEGFRELLRSESFDSRCISIVCDAGGDLLISGSPDMNVSQEKNFSDVLRGSGMSDADRSGVMAEIAQGIPGEVTYSISGRDRYVYYAPLGIEGWMLFTVVPGEVVDSETADINRTGVLSLMVLLVTSLALVALIVAMASRRSRELREVQRMEVNRLAAKADSDALTGLLNQRATLAQIERYISGAGRAGRHALYIVDLDGFKRINDRWGHPEGDRVIAVTGAAISRVFRATDIVGRLGGDEFMVLLKNAVDDRLVKDKGDELCASLRGVDLSSDAQAGPELTVSVGAAIYEADDISFETLYKRADAEMYAVKRAKYGQC